MEAYSVFPRRRGRGICGEDASTKGKAEMGLEGCVEVYYLEGEGKAFQEQHVGKQISTTEPGLLREQ